MDEIASLWVVVEVLVVRGVLVVVVVVLDPEEVLAQVVVSVGAGVIEVPVVALKLLVWTVEVLVDEPVVGVVTADAPYVTVTWASTSQSPELPNWSNGT